MHTRLARSSWIIRCKGQIDTSQRREGLGSQGASRYTRVMQLLRMRVTKLGPFEDIELGFDEDGEPRPITVVHGAGGVGKTTLLNALACTRPGHAVVAPGQSESAEQATTVCEFRLGWDEPERPHPLVVASPNVRVYEDEAAETLRRKEQVLFDRIARETGFVFISIPATRWFSRQPVVIQGSARGMARYDVRAPLALEDPGRADLARETKQVLAYAAITRALRGSDPMGRTSKLADALEHAVNTLLELAGATWIGLDPHTLEPTFRTDGGRVLPFDQLPTRVRHLVAFAVLPVRALWAAYPEREPRYAEGIVAIDEVDLNQDDAVRARLIPALRAALPGVQWIVTATSSALAASCSIGEVLVLRRTPEAHERVELFTGDLARIH